MAGWDVLEDLAAGQKMLVREPLWTEVRRAAAERRSAQALFAVWGYPPPGPPVLVARRDAVGSIREYRYYFLGLLSTGFGLEHDIFAQECEASEAVLPWVCKRFAAYVTGGGYVDVFLEAGLPNADWTHTNTGMQQGRLWPPLPYADAWTDFPPVLNCLTFLWLWTVNPQGDGAEIQFGESLYGDEWPATRASAWSSIPTEAQYPYFDDGPPVGRCGAGDQDHDGGDYWFNARVGYRPWFQWAMDLSNLWQVRHLDRYLGEVLAEGDGTAGPYSGALARPVVPGSLLLRAGTQYVKDDGEGGLVGAGTGTVNYETAAIEVTFNRAVAVGLQILADYDSRSPCDPTRLVFYLWQKPWMVDDVACPCRVKLSGDGGSTWETLGEFETVQGTTALKCEKFVSTDATRWTADTVLRVEYAGDEHADTPGWPAPTVEETILYGEAAYLVLSPPFAEFDWDFKGS
jgi:hypothetical protein